MTDTGMSLRTRAALAIALTVVFYAMALIIGLGLIAAPIVLYAVEGAGNVWLTIATIAAGVAVLRAMVPPRDAFVAPGPELTRDAHPRLHALLDEVAATTGSASPDHVYLDLDVNASVLEHRGKRVLNLGLPLLAVLDQQELRAVVAHEYGHYTGGDTRFAGWIWRTRASAITTVATLAHSESVLQRAIVRWPFEGYARLFLRITNAVSRRAEYAADAVAAVVAGSPAAGRALRRIGATAPVFDGFWQGDVVPMLASDRRPQLAAGFVEAVSHRDTAAVLDRIVAEDIAVGDPDPYASHPTLRQRLEALGTEVDATAPAPAACPALNLLGDVSAAERALLVSRFGEEVGTFPEVPWEEAGSIHAGLLASRVVEHPAPEAAGLTVGAVADALRDDEQRQEHFDALADRAAYALLSAGLTLTAAPGEPVLLHEGDATLCPWTVLGLIADGKEAVATWTSHPVVAAHAGLPLVA